MKARYEGDCAACDKHIRMGDPIRRDGRRWIHEACHLREEQEDDGDRWEREQEERERSRMDAEYEKGVQDVKNWQENKRMFGDEAADRMEIERELREGETTDAQDVYETGRRPTRHSRQLRQAAETHASGRSELGGERIDDGRFPDGSYAQRPDGIGDQSRQREPRIDARLGSLAVQRRASRLLRKSGSRRALAEKGRPVWHGVFGA